VRTCLDHERIDVNQARLAAMARQIPQMSPQEYHQQVEQESSKEEGHSHLLIPDQITSFEF